MALPSLGKSNGEDREPKNSQGKLPEIELPSTGLPGLGSSLPPTEPKKDTFDSRKDFDSEEFKPVSVDEALYKEDDVQENKEIYEESDNIDSSSSLGLPSVETTDKDLLKEGSDYNPDYEEDLKKEHESKFVDKKKKKIIPIGGKKSKKDKKKFVRASDFDERKNKLAKTKVIQFLILSVIFIMFFVGLKNTFFPAHVYTDEQIRQFGAEGAGETGFPKERGRAFVESYISTYLTVDKEREDYNEVLGHFYGVDTYDRKSNSSNFKHSSDVAQHIIIEPKVFNIELMTAYSAQYKVSTFVSDSSGKEAEGEESSGRWLSFSVNLYYNKDNDSLAITPDSPSVIPSTPIENDTVVPSRVPLGDGTINNEIGPALEPTIHGFIKAYAESSLKSHDSVLQYIVDEKNPDLINGFGGSVELDGAEPKDAISTVIYNGRDGIYRVDVTVKWKDTVSKDEKEQINYTSRYIMRVNKIANGKYAVSSFVPYTYFNAED